MFPQNEDDLDAELDEGFEDNMDVDVVEEIGHSEDIATVAHPTDLESEEEDEVRNHSAIWPYFMHPCTYYYVQGSSQSAVESGDESQESLDSRGIPGWDKVDKLAHELIGLSGLSITNAQAQSIKRLYNDLLPYDKSIP